VQVADGLAMVGLLVTKLEAVEEAEEVKVVEAV